MSDNYKKYVSLRGMLSNKTLLLNLCIKITKNGVVPMKIYDLLKQLNDRFPTSTDKERMVENLFRKREELHVCDLDLALIFLDMTIHFKNIDARGFFGERKELLMAVADSSYAKYFAPELFQGDVVTVDDEKRSNDVTAAVVEGIFSMQIKNDGVNAIDGHELLTEIDVKLLDVTKSKVVNASDTVKIEIHCNKYYSFALSQTKYKIISDIIITSLSDEAIKDAKLVIDSDPSYIEFSDINVPLINPHQPIAITEFDINTHIEQLMELQEKVAGTLTIKLIVGEDELVSLTTEIEYFSFDTLLENAMNGSTALFVTPNDVAVQNTIALVAKEMQSLSGSSSLPDYQVGDKNNVVMQLKALFNTLHKEAIAYITVPPSYENVGQKVRLPHDVLVHKQGTCFDLTILFLACVERMGLNAFLVKKTGHAFAGVFLEKNTFPTMNYNDAPHALEMNSQEENEIVFIECTAYTADNASSFEEACELGRQNVASSIADPYFEIIDIQRARAYGFLPLPINYNDIDRAVVDYDVVQQNKIRLARKDYSYKGDKLELSQAELNKFDVWEKKLLDLSRRNQLVSYKTAGRGLQLCFYDLNALYRAFESDNGNYHVAPAKLTEHFVFELPTATEEQYAQIKRDFNNRNIGLVLRSQAQETSLRFFEKERRKSFEETGSNILYLAIGFIQYFENPKSVNPCYAPIVLVPIDLVRHSKDNYSIKGREEPPFLNISIFEFFHQEFGLNCDDLLTQIDFESEDIDIDVVLNTVAERISKLSRASIIRTAAINVFNFSKAVMWSDVRFRKAELSKNKVIKSIIEGRFACEDDDQIGNDYDDDASNPEDLAIPLPADSSQIIAIEDCTKGKSFILQGPPGTGKSQTITNMIVNAIYHGKTVLFVAEKMAALEVVQKRLNQLCLGRFALEAHSAKADKSSLMAQFEERILLGSTVSTKEDYLAIANQLKIERKELNRVINLLHKENGYIMSFYDAFVNYLDIGEEVPVIDVLSEYMDSLNIAEFREAARLCDKLYGEILSNGGYYNNPFILFRDSNYIPGVTKRTVLEKTDTYRKILVSFIEQLKTFNNDNSLSLELNEKTLTALGDFLKEDQKVINCITSLIGTDLCTLDNLVTGVINKGKEYQKSLSIFKNDFSSQIYDLDYESDYIQYKNLDRAFFLKKIFGQKKLLKKVMALCKNPKLYQVKDLPKLYDALKNIKESESVLIEQMTMYNVAFGNPASYEIKNFDFEKFEGRYLATKELIEKYSKVFTLQELLTLVTKTQSFSLKGKDIVLGSMKQLSEVGQVMKRVGFDFSLCTRYGFGCEKLLEFIDRWVAKIDYLPNWCSLLSVIKEIKNHNLGFIIDLIENNELITSNIEFIYKKSVFGYIINVAISGDESGSFNSVELKHHVDHYKELLEKFKELTVKETAARVSASMPSINENSPASSQQGILNKAVKNKCRGKAIRQLFGEVPDILTKLFPVFLMSPISCAQYLSPDMPKFDIVIFDEASQMPTSEAIGAIARGKSLIVVGDSKQMPPTAFFQSKVTDDLDSYLDDQQSILDDCDVIGMPSRCLNWHYRSKHESLIRFSNVKFYGNNLVTFPSPNDMVTKVSFVNTKGVYGGKRATNEIEAKAIIKEVERRLKSPELRKRSIGIVTFSSVQQDMLDDLLQDFFAKHKDLEKINLESKEPIIVKNLENIQGDERDVILFSVCYGPDKTGVMHYRFGPINNSGGEKRLNVAVSRARYEMMIFASFEPELLANMKTESRGAQELYNFLKYAKYGADALIVPNGSAIETRVGFEKHIALSLEEKGYQVNVDVGKSSFRVDIGVVNPDNKDEYILGILCDSYSYESALTSRDRNIVQPNTLDLLGWNLIRVWSFDYLDNPKQVIQEICQKIEDIRMHPENYKHTVQENPQLEIEFETKEIEQVNYSKPYISYNKVNNIYGSGYDDIYSKQKIIREILDIEAPISEEVLRNRFANAIGVARAGNRIQDDMRRCLSMIGAKKNKNFAGDKFFYWRADQCDALGRLIELQYYRIGGDKPRAMDDVPKEEIFVAIKEVLTNDGPMFKEELKRYVARVFEIKSVGSKVDKAIDDCVACYISKGELIMIDNNSRVALKTQGKQS